jgi:hypothetical protein
MQWSGQVLLSNFDSYIQLAKKQNHTEILKISIRLMLRRKLGRPDGLKPIRRPTLPAITVRTMPAAKEINQAGK